MLPVRSVLVDFDGTACLHDVAEHLLERFGDPSWSDYDDAETRGEIGSREALAAQSAMLTAPQERMLEFAVDHCKLDPTFGPFVQSLEAKDVPVTLVSDGFGFYIGPILEPAGLGHLNIVTNAFVPDSERPHLEHANGHPECRGCGTCKMLAAVEAGERAGPVAFVGEGQSDRYGALYSDIVFAKKELVRICQEDGVPFLPWETFDDVRRVLEDTDRIPGPVAPQRCPGWRTA
jgi:2-hydroxy-3-keto-5-methylthiopentenyl-1-phosphate phosphatase